MALAQITYQSQLFHRPVRLAVILPDDSAPKGLLLMLPGYSDCYDSILHSSGLERYCAGVPLAVVLPEAQNSFYLNTGFGQPFWDNITKEIPQVLKQWFNLSFPRERCFVGGISMGGYGAAKVALTYPEKFSKAFLFSPAVDIVKIAREGFDRTIDPLAPVFEEMHLDALVGHRTLEGSSDDLYQLLKTCKPAALPEFSIFTGTEDFVYRDILAFRDALEKLGVPVSLETCPGIHGWDVWVPYIRKMIGGISGLL